MKFSHIFVISFLTITTAFSQQPNAVEVLQKVDDNLIAKTVKSSSRMIIHGRRTSRTLTSRSYSRGEQDGFTEYLSPAREKGTKMLKLEDKLWIYSPSTDRTIQLSGHMLRQSVMGSDMSYEDAMEDRKLSEMYTPTIETEEEIEGRKVWVMVLNAKVDDATYHSRKIWVDVERFIPLKEELYAKSGQLLKRVVASNVQQVDGRWYPMAMNYKDMLKDGKGTDFIVESIEFNIKIPAHILSKAALKQ